MKQKKLNSKNPTVISLFTCGMGMDVGFEKAKFQTVYTNDITKFACNTIRQNRSEIPCDEGDITNISSKEILKKSKHKKGEIDVVIGGPPCQSFSTAGARKGLEDKRGMALLEFIRVIRDVQPKFFVFENVPGLKSIAKKHISFYDRMSVDKKTLSSDQQYGSLFGEILDEFNKLKKYKSDWDILNSADYGVPQKRKRLILIGSRTMDPKIIFEKIKKNAKFADPKKAEKEGKKPWKTLRDALDGLKDDKMERTEFPKWGKYLKHIPAGGCWVDLPENLKKEAMGRAANSDDPKRKGKQGGRTGFFRRLSWDKPSPTLVTSPSQMGTCLCHPDEDRPLTVKEYAKLQGFPAGWKFIGSTSQKYRMIGEAVPVPLAKVIAKTVKDFI
jgi:DNA (cytosine-5)-methyltransferase 1